MDKISFGYILSKLSTYNGAKCASYSHSARTTFSTYAVKYLVLKERTEIWWLNHIFSYFYHKTKLYRENRTTLQSTDLDELSYCFSPTISLDTFNGVSAYDFMAKAFFYQGIQFQPSNAAWISAFSKKNCVLI